MEDSISRHLSIKSYPSENLARNKSIEGICDFRKKDIGRAFVDVDEQLKQVALAKNWEQIRRIIPDVRNRLFELCNLWLEGLDVRSFAEHAPGDKTPLNAECC